MGDERWSTRIALLLVLLTCVGFEALRHSAAVPAALRLAEASVPARVLMQRRGRKRVHPLLHSRTVRDAQRAAQACDGPLLFASFYADGAHPPIVHAADASCVLFFVGKRVARLEANTTWTYILLRRTPASASFAPRKMSRVPKLLPHLLFPGRTTVYFDVKLQLKATPSMLAALLTSATTLDATAPSFVAFRHPCVGHSGFAPRFCECVGPSGCDAWTWLTREAQSVRLNQAQTADPQLLDQQITRYASDPATPPHAFRTYIDGALLVQRDAAELFELWQSEYFRDDSADRDQPAFAYAVARARTRVVALTCANVLPPTRLCHWYRDQSVAKLVKPPPRPPPTTAIGSSFAAAASAPAVAHPRACVRRWRESEIAAFMADHPQRAYFSHLLRLAGLTHGAEVRLADGRFSEHILQPGRAPDSWAMVEPRPTTQLVQRAQIDNPIGGGRPTAAEAGLAWAARGIGERTRVVFLGGNSTDQHVLRFLRPRSLDFVYLRSALDGTVSAKRELIAYWQRIRAGGILAGDGYCNHGEPPGACRGCERIPRCQAADETSGRMARAVHEWLDEHEPTARLYHTAENYTREGLKVDGLDYDLVATSPRTASWFVVKPHAARLAPPPPSKQDGPAQCAAPGCALGRRVSARAHDGSLAPQLSIQPECAAARSFTPPALPSPRDVGSRSNATLTLVLIYYAAPSLLVRHLRTLRSCAAHVRSLVHLLIIDDGSPADLDAASYVPPTLGAGLASLVIARIEQDLLWNIGGARNLAFHLARTPRVLLLDVDTPAPPPVMAAAVHLPALTADGVPIAHRFNRIRPDGTLKPSPAAVLMSAASYWAVGGCDEDFVGNYGQTDVHFWHRARRLPSSDLVIRAHDDLRLEELAKPDNPCEELSRDGWPAHLVERCAEAVRLHATVVATLAQSRDIAANAMLFRWKLRTGRWSDMHLRFTWALAQPGGPYA